MRSERTAQSQDQTRRFAPAALRLLDPKRVEPDGSLPAKAKRSFANGTERWPKAPVSSLEQAWRTQSKVHPKPSQTVKNPRLTGNSLQTGFRNPHSLSLYGEPGAPHSS